MSRRRDYKDVSVAERDEGLLILLDSKAASTPGGAPLVLPSRALADAIVAEWQVQDQRLDPASMPLTRFASLAIDRAPEGHGEVIEHALSFGRNDLLCYRAESPPELTLRQSESWDPLLAWAHEKHGIRLIADAGIAYIEQPVDALLRMQEIVSGLDDFALVAFDTAATLAGSFVLALALLDRQITAQEAFVAAQLDELYQADKWGHDAEAEMRRERLFGELNAVARLVRLLCETN